MSGHPGLSSARILVGQFGQNIPKLLLGNFLSTDSPPYSLAIRSYLPMLNSELPQFLSHTGRPCCIGLLHLLRWSLIKFPLLCFNTHHRMTFSLIADLTFCFVFETCCPSWLQIPDLPASARDCRCVCWDYRCEPQFLAPYSLEDTEPGAGLTEHSMPSLSPTPNQL
jgi:hypothetical protein